MTEDDIEDSVNAHQARNAKLIELIIEKHLDPSQASVVDLYFWCPDIQSAEALRSDLEKRGHSEVSVSQHSPDSKWALTSVIEISPSRASERPFTEQLVRVAAQWGAEYDGWGMSL